MSIQVAHRVKDLAAPLMLEMAPLVVTPYWVIDLLKERGLPMSTLLNRAALSDILTSVDLEIVMSLCPFYELKNEQMLKLLSPYTKTLVNHDLLNITERGRGWRTVPQLRNEVRARRVMEAKSYGDAFNDPSQYVKPASSGAITCEYGMDIILFVIDDTSWGDSTDGLLILGCYLSETSQSDDMKSDELMRLQSNLALLSRYYGVAGLAKTPLMARFIELTQPVIPV